MVGWKINPENLLLRLYRRAIITCIRSVEKNTMRHVLVKFLRNQGHQPRLVPIQALFCQLAGRTYYHNWSPHPSYQHQYHHQYPYHSLDKNIIALYSNGPTIVVFGLGDSSFNSWKNSTGGVPSVLFYSNSNFSIALISNSIAILVYQILMALFFLQNQKFSQIIHNLVL